MTKRLNTHLQSEGAEFLVLGNLLMRGIEAHKTYSLRKGFDLVAMSVDNHRAVTISVKARHQTDWDGFIAKNIEADFTVFVALNRGYARKRKTMGDGVRDPDFYIFPKSVMESMPGGGDWGKRFPQKMADLERYKDAWDLISEQFD